METSGIIHAHSAYSYDAKHSLEELKEMLLEQGIRFVCMTEHTDKMTEKDAEEFVRECETLSDESFLFIPGFEVPYKSAHILMIGQRDFYTQYAADIEALRQWTDQTPFVVLAHPVRNRFEVEDDLLDQIDALEIWNQQYDGKRVARTKSFKLYKVLKEKRQNLVATGGVDLHRKEHIGSPLITLNVSELVESEIIDKLKQGAFTISSPQIRLHGALPAASVTDHVRKIESGVSVTVIVLGKFVNSILASLGLSLPDSLKQTIRRRL